MYAITIRTIIALPVARQTEASYASTLAESSQANFASNIHKATVMLGQSKLCVRRALRLLPDDQPHIRRALESLSAGVQRAIETSLKIAVTR